MSNTQQIEYWNGEAAQTWVKQADALDLMLHDVGAALLNHAALRAGQCVIDIGCGSGAVTMAAQNRVGDAGQAIGLDISRPLLDNARRRALEHKSRAKFIEADASIWKADASADAIVSRFCVMFFDNPVAAFANILQAIKPSGALTFACWRSPKENDMGSGLMKATSHLFTPPEVKPDPTAPGPFAFAEQPYVESILSQAGWRDVRFDTWNGRLPLVFATARENADALAQMGPVGRMMREQNVPREKVEAALASFLEQRCDNGRYYLNGAVWMVSARRG
jgi:ubiquinone/menaquinone biosynthesis C-methylase UbiE